MTQVWEIIPKITSPLAVLCFAFYIFYLFKQSEDKKKEKSLEVDDPQAKRQAVNLILKDIPDVSIDTIKEPKAALELAKQIIEDRVKRHNKTLNTLLLFTSIFALTFLLSLVITSGKVFASKDDKKTQAGASLLTWAETEASKTDNAYALVSVVQHIKLEDVILLDSSKKREALFRNYYTVRALKDITRQDPVFEEQFLSSVIKIDAWAGSETQEVTSIVDGRYWVKFDAKKNEIATITTGANYYYPIPLPNNNLNSCFGNVTSDNSEWLTCYPNSTDYIDNLTIIVESKNVDISLPPNSSYRKTKEGAVLTGDGTCRIYSTNNHCTLVAKWTQIKPGECVGFKIRWSLPKL